LPDEVGAPSSEPSTIEAEPTSTAPPEEERRRVTILFADLAGFTSMSEGMDPEAVKALASRCAELMSEEVRRVGGTVSSVMGDAIMAMFGAPISHEDDPERAVRAAVAMRDRIGEIPGPKTLQLHVGINTGETMAGAMGPDEARDYTAMGDTTNTAARLMSAAPTGSIYIGEETFLATQRSVEAYAVEPVRAKGKAEPVSVWEVTGISAVPTERPIGSAPLIGRDRELSELVRAWDRVRRGDGPVQALVLGPPGIGKSRLLGEFLQRAGDQGQILRGRCLPYGEGITYWPLVEMIDAAAGITHDDDEASSSRKLGTLIEALPTDDPDELRTIATTLASLVAAPTTPRGSYRATTITRGELHWGIRRLFELSARGRPLVLLFEDLHWAEPTLLELLDEVNGGDGASILILGSARPELADAWAGAASDGRRTTIPLEALTPEESASLIATLVPDRAPAGGRLEAILRSAAGNPLFLEETVRMLAETGELDQAGSEVMDESAVPVPGSIQGLIDSRLDLLPTRDRRLAQLASVVGLVFWSGLVDRLDGGGADGVVEAMRRLEDRDLVHAHAESSIADESEFAFKHALIRDVAYGRLPKKRRSELHARCADWVSKLPGPEDELIEIVAYHLESACSLAIELDPATTSAPRWPAAEALGRAAAKAERREGTAEADRFYARALQLIADDRTEGASELGLRRARTLNALGRSKDAIQLLHEVAEQARALDRSDLRGQALVSLANVLQRLGRPGEAREHLTEAASIATSVDDPHLQIRAAFESAEILADFEGRADAAVADLQRGLRTAEEIDDLALRIEGHLRSGTVLATAGRLAEAEGHLVRCAELADRTGSYRDDARAAYLLAYSKLYLGESDEAERLAVKAAEWLERTGDRYFQIQNLLLLGRLGLIRGDVEAAARWAQQAELLAQTLGGWLLVETCRSLAEIRVLGGELEHAAEAASMAAEAAPEEDAFARAESLVAAGLVEIAEGAEGAADRLQEALALLQQHSVPIELAEARISGARVLALRGDVEGARRLLDEVRASVQGTEARMLITVADEMSVGLRDRRG
jgi:class 3 adenylate cyclase/tetratricopeptide (TPR) repeat protein